MMRPFEVDPEEYPFKDHWLPYREGSVHYVDEGQGPARIPNLHHESEEP